MSLSPIAREALKTALAVLTPTEQDCHGDVIARALEVLDLEGRLVGADAVRVAESADKLTRLLAPTQVLLEDPHDSPLHHRYRTPHDLELPPMGGVS